MSGRLLLLVRHAKAVPIAATDAERELSGRGHRDAGRAGDWLAEFVTALDLVVVSPAVRARETWEDIAVAVPSALVRVDERIYENTVEELFAVLADVPDDVDMLALVGHNPSMHALAAVLDNGDGDPDSSAALAGHYPTCAIAVFDVEGGWSDVADGNATLRTFAIPG